MADYTHETLTKRLFPMEESSQEEIRKRIVSDYYRGMTISAIARYYKYHPQSIRRILRKYRIRHTCKRLEGSGRKPSLTKEQKKRIINKVKADPFCSLYDIQYDLNLDVSLVAIHKYLRKKGYRSKKTREVPKLFDDDPDKRLQWIPKVAHIPYRAIVFTDECHFWLGDKRGYAWTKEGEEIQEEVESFPQKVSLWGAICYWGKVSFHVFTQNLNGSRYRELLQKRLVPGLSFVARALAPYSFDEFFLQQDNSKIHCSTKVQNFIQEYGINQIEWPARSPDLNPIENLWGVLKKRVRKQAPKTLKELKKVVINEWNKFDDAKIRQFCASFPNRIKKLKEFDGKCIGY